MRGACLESIEKLLPGPYFDFDRQRRGVTRGVDCAADATSGGDVIVLDENRVVEAHAMIRDSSGGGGHLFETAQAGRGLASIEDATACPGDTVDVTGGERRDTAQALQKIQCNALAGEQRAGVPGYRRDGLTGGDPVAAALEQIEAGHTAAHVVDQGQQLDAGDHLRLAREEIALGRPVRRNAGFGCDVAGADVFLERAANEAGDLWMRDIHHAARPSSAALFFLSCDSYSVFLRRISSITCGGALLTNVSLLSWRSEFSIFFSSC